MCDMFDMLEASEMERYLIRFDKWDRKELEGVVPDDVIEELFSPSTDDDGNIIKQPIGLGRHPEKGWFVLGAGQGPFFIWAQWDKRGESTT